MIDICVYCKQPYTKHLISNYSNCPTGFKDIEGMDLFWGGQVFYPMDNLTYVEHLAKEKNLI